MSKLGLTLIAITAVSIAVATQASFNIQAADAQQRIQNNSVRSETIVDGQVKTQDLADDAVTSPKIRNGEVKSDDIEDGTVTSQDIAPGTIPSDGGGGTPDDNSVTSAKIVDGEVKSVDIGDGEVTSADIEDSTITSTDLASGAILISRAFNTIPITGVGLADINVDCPPGQIITGGGFSRGDTSGNFPEGLIHVKSSYPVDADTWYVQVYNEADSQTTLTGYALCV